MWSERYVVMPRNMRRSCLSFGVSIFRMSSALSGSGKMPSFVYLRPKKVISCCFILHFWELKVRPSFLAVSRNDLRRLSCSASVDPCMIMSSLIPMHPLHLLMIWSIRFW